jgi:hypothetical protein
MKAVFSLKYVVLPLALLSAMPATAAVTTSVEEPTVKRAGLVVNNSVEDDHAITVLAYVKTPCYVC